MIRDWLFKLSILLFLSFTCIYALLRGFRDLGAVLLLLLIYLIINRKEVMRDWACSRS